MWSTRLLLRLDREKVQVLISILIILEIVNFEKFKKEEEFLNRSLFYYRERKGLIIEFASSNLIKSLTLVLYFQPNRKILRSLPPIFLLFSSMGVVQIRYFGTSHPFPSFFLSPLPLRPRFITYIYIYRFFRTFLLPNHLSLSLPFQFANTSDAKHEGIFNPVNQRGGIEPRATGSFLFFNLLPFPFPLLFPASPTPRVTPRDSQGARRVETICSPMINVLDWNGSISSWMNNCTCSFEAALTCINLWRSGMAHTYAALVGILRTWKVIIWKLLNRFEMGEEKIYRNLGD